MEPNDRRFRKWLIRVLEQFETIHGMLIKKCLLKGSQMPPTYTRMRWLFRRVTDKIGSLPHIYGS